MNLSSEIGINIHASELTFTVAYFRYHVPIDSVTLFFGIFTYTTHTFGNSLQVNFTSLSQLVKSRYTAKEQRGVFFKLVYIVRNTLT